MFSALCRAREREAERQKVSGASVNYYASKCVIVYKAVEIGR